MSTSVKMNRSNNVLQNNVSALLLNSRHGQQQQQQNQQQQQQQQHPQQQQQRQQHQQNQQPTDMFVACFEAALNEELKEQTISSSFRACFEKIGSPYGFIRSEGLREALQRLSDFSVEAAEEAARSAEMNGKNPAAPHVPFDAIRSAVMSRTAVEMHSGGPTPLPLSTPAAIASSSTTTAAAAAAVVMNTGGTNTTLSSAVGSSCKSASWERTQRALHGAHYTTAVFECVLVPRIQERSRYNPGGSENIELSEEEALVWNTLTHAQSTTTPTPAVSATTSRTATVAPVAGKRKPLDVVLSEVTYQEQELAFRLLQGLSLLVYDQRRVIAEGLLIPYAIEIWQCCLQHIEALFRRRRRNALVEKPAGDSNSHMSIKTLLAEDGPIQLISGLETVVIASIDAVEAACHYNPLALVRIVQQGGIRALLDMGLCPYAPYDIRCAVFDTISVLMQEVAPFRRAVAAGGAAVAAAVPLTAMAGGNNNSNSNNNNGEDDLIHTMIQETMTGSVSRQAAPPPYLMDRASASKFDSAVREWFSQRGLSHVISAVMELRDVRGTPIAAGTMSKAEVTRIVQRASQLREKRLQALLQAVDGKRAAL
ncbi:uncharacterized protein TM35_000311790 [Trypanosoma theileri]|uniref:Uncharacterized protein n=1 Tax=Trypanosoma theileri TaxID=67003 RepID=A0A1X0NNC0_9TRYP|nr:uncharacterized protein TM35_000311790 [Trypanosoma theileri]ORC85993.1 hypothetical protein TM35_000311790 [Trypanosoma theileri]